MDNYYLDPNGNVILRIDDWPIDEDGDLLCWGSAGADANTSDVETLWYPPEDLSRPISEEKAREVHPNFFLHLEKVNREEI